MSKKLEPLGDYNARRRESYGPRPEMPNGIACPNCGEELHDANPGVTLASYPPKTKVECRGCVFRGYRIV